MCEICGYENIKKDPINLFTDAELEEFIDGMITGIYSPQRLPTKIYTKTARKLVAGVYEGFGKELSETLYQSPDYRMLWDLKNNVYIFSGAKTYQQAKAVEALLTDKEAVTSFSDFKKNAKKVLTTYNENYLRAEYNLAITASSSASRWMEIDEMAADFPLLEYQTIGDGRVRPTHAALDGKVRPVNDKFWDLYYPPNGWNCRCSAIQIGPDEKPITSLRGFKKPNDVPDEFLYNPGKDRIVFTKAHPYFDIAKKDKALAKRNFDLEIE